MKFKRDLLLNNDSGTEETLAVIPELPVQAVVP
jgi:hypothetical protein